MTGNLCTAPLTCYFSSSKVYQFQQPNKHLTGMGIVTDAKVKQAAKSYLNTFDIDFFYSGIQVLLYL
jgi:hypothetical protein